MIARLARAVKFCRTIVVDTDLPHVARRRRAGSAAAVGLANAVLICERNPVRFLYESDWLTHEVAMYRAAGVAVADATDGTIRLPVFPGRTLGDLLRQADRPTRAEALRLCVKNLTHLHARGGSHGDAHGDNVIVDVEKGVAQWIDFETAYLPSAAAPERLANDLRALIESSLFANDESAADLIEPLRAVDSAVAQSVAQSVVRMVRSPGRSLFHRAQGDPPPAVRRRFCDALDAAID